MNNIHDRARQMVAQSRAPMSLSEAYSALAKRRRAKPKREESMAGDAVMASDVCSRPTPRLWYQLD